MKTYNKLLSEYLSENNTATKRLINLKMKESLFKMEHFFDNLLFKCGINSVNVTPTLDSRSKYEAYINFQDGNIFIHDKGISELISTPVNFTRAQEILANKVIGMLSTVHPEKIRLAIS